MRRRQVLTGLAALGVVAVGEATLHPTRLSAGGPAGGRPRSAWPAGAGDARVEVTFRVRTPRRALALTFDDGPDPRWTPQVLELLDRHGATATFFVIGHHARRHPGLLRRVAAAGHSIGNHTDSHADLTTLSLARAATELARATEAVADITGQRPTLFRPPYGHVDPVGLLAAAEAGLATVLWWQLIRGSAPAPDGRACVDGVRPGSIVLAHDGGRTPNAELMLTLSEVTGRLRAGGYALVDVPALLRSADPT